MDTTLQLFIALIVIATLVLSAFYSYKSRREQDGGWRGLYTARMNINMGVMLIALGVLLLLMFTGSSVRVVVSMLFMLLGLFNLFAGIRNRSYYTRVITERSSR